MKILSFISDNSNFILCILTFIYSITTLFILLSNNRSATSAQKQATLSQEAIQTSIDLQLYEKRLAIANNIENNNYTDTVMEIHLLFGNDVLKQVKQIKNLQEQLEHYKNNLDTYYSIVDYENEQSYHYMVENSECNITYVDYLSKQKYPDKVSNSYPDEYGVEQTEWYIFSELTVAISSLEDDIKQSQRVLKLNILEQLENIYTLNKLN